MASLTVASLTVVSLASLTVVSLASLTVVSLASLAVAHPAVAPAAGPAVASPASPAAGPPVHGGDRAEIGQVGQRDRRRRGGCRGSLRHGGGAETLLSPW